MNVMKMSQASADGGSEGEHKAVGVEFLDVDASFHWNEEGWIDISTGVFRKKAAADIYLHYVVHTHRLSNEVSLGARRRGIYVFAISERSLRRRGPGSKRPRPKRGYMSRWIDRVVHD